MRVRYFWWLAILTVTITTIAQQSQCSPLVQEALLNMEENCADLDRNNACYGNDSVKASFTTAPDIELEESFFTQPADISSLDILDSIQTLPRNDTNNEWGVAIMKAQASLPDTLPGQSVTFVLLGDVSMENAVEATDTTESIDPIAITATLNVALRQQPAAESESIALVPANATMLTDAISEDGKWLRVAYDNLPGWVLRSYTDSDDSVLNLPVAGNKPVAPMQSFYLKVSPSGTNCVQTPDNSLLIQTPEGIEVDLTVNGADIRVGSTILIWSPLPGVLEILVLDGSVLILPTPENPEGIRLYQWQRSQTCTGDDAQTFTCGWSPPQDIPLSELQDVVCGAESFAGLNYEVDMPCTIEEINELIVIAEQRNNPPAPEGTAPPPETTPNIFDEEGLLDNKCYPGGEWDDGRCDDPELSEWFWTAGWYIIRFEDGRIDYDDLPDQFQPGTPEPDAPGSSGFTASWSCTGGMFTLSWSNAPAGTTTLDLSWDEDGQPGSIGISGGVSGSHTFNSLSGEADLSSGGLTALPASTSTGVSPGTISHC
ncbi:MAG: hypothetical protein ACPG7F_02275 [Aggregatilineales bacterium]